MGPASLPAEGLRPFAGPLQVTGSHWGGGGGRCRHPECEVETPGTCAETSWYFN